MNKKILTLLSLLVLAGMVLAACAPAAPEIECTDEIGCVELAPDDDVHIASMLTITGATAFLGEDSSGADGLYEVAGKGFNGY